MEELPNVNLRVGERVRYMPRVYGDEYTGTVVKAWVENGSRQVDVEYRSKEGFMKLAKNYYEGYWYRLEEYNPIEVY